jgi:hypothetical protein
MDTRSDSPWQTTGNALAAAVKHKLNLSKKVVPEVPSGFYPNRIGSRLILLPTAIDTAFTTAGAIGGTPVSPIPVGDS